jgi:hypothetical protein
MNDIDNYEKDIIFKCVLDFFYNQTISTNVLPNSL